MDGAFNPAPLDSDKEVTVPRFDPADTMCFFSSAASKTSQPDNVFVNRLATQLLKRCLHHLSSLSLDALLLSPRIHLCKTAWLTDSRYHPSHRFNEKSRFSTLKAERNEMASTVSSYVGSQVASNVSSNNGQRSTPPTSGEEMLVGPSRAQFQKYYHEIKPLAAGANGETFLVIPKKKAASICEKVDSSQPQGQFFDSLRAEIVVAKFPKLRRGTTDELDNEIAFLNYVLPKGENGNTDVPVTKMLDHHEHKASPWLTLGFAKGGDLCSLIKRHPKDLTLGMRWHLGLKLVEAIAYLHYGATDLSGVTDESDGRVWPQIWHGDFHTGNILLTSSSEGEYQDYPDLKLADFGRTKYYIEPETRNAMTRAAAHSSVRYPGHVVAFKHSQLIDFRSAGLILQGMALIYHRGKVCPGRHCDSNCGKCPRADCEECLRIAKMVGMLEGLGQDERLFLDNARELRNFQGSSALHTREEGLRALKAFATMAMEQRDRHYVPLSDAARSKLDAVKVTDEEIDSALGLNIGMGG